MRIRIDSKWKMAVLLWMSLSVNLVFGQAGTPVRETPRYGVVVDAYDHWGIQPPDYKMTLAYGVVSGQYVFVNYLLYWYGEDAFPVDLTELCPNTVGTKDLVELVDWVYRNKALRGIPYADIIVNCEAWMMFKEKNNGKW